MVCEHILGNTKDFELTGKKIELVEINWDETFKKIHRKVTDSGREVGIRLDDSVLTKGMNEGDVLYADDDLIIVVYLAPCEVIQVQVAEDHKFMAAKVCYEIGNRHAPLFYGEDELSFITLYNDPMLEMLQSMHGVSVEKKVSKLDLDRRISAVVHKHQH